MTREKTICALATAAGGAIGIIRVSGNNTFQIINKIFTKDLTAAKANTINYGHIINAHNDIIDEVLISVFRAPHSYTGEDVVEINCHGGNQITKQILEIVLESGARLAEPGEFSKRAFLNGKMDLSQAEAVINLINAKTKTETRIAANNLEGNLSKRIRELRETRDLSMQELANYLEVSKSSVNMWENAGVVPREPILKKISQAFDVTIDYLLGNTTREQEQERVDNLNDINALFQQLLGNLSEEDLDKFIQIIELMFALDPSKKIDNFAERLKGFYQNVKEAQKHGGIIGKVLDEDDNIEMWKFMKDYEKIHKEVENEENND